MNSFLLQNRGSVASLICLRRLYCLFFLAQSAEDGNNKIRSHRSKIRSHRSKIVKYGKCAPKEQSNIEGWNSTAPRSTQQLLEQTVIKYNLTLESLIPCIF